MDLKKLDYITAPEEWIEDILEKSSKTSPSKAFWRRIWFDCSDDWIFSDLLHFSNSCSNEIYSFSDMA